MSFMDKYLQKKDEEISKLKKQLKDNEKNSKICKKCGNKYPIIRVCCDNPTCYLVALHKTQLAKKHSQAFSKGNE